MTRGGPALFEIVTGYFANGAAIDGAAAPALPVGARQSNAS